MLEKNIVKYKVSRQLKLALEQLNHRIIKKDYKVIETQDILFCILDICDTGMGYALGYYSLTKSKLLREYSKGKFIGSEQRCTLETDEIKDFSKRRVMHEWITSSPVEIIQEPSSSYYLSECDEFPISEYLKLIFDFAEEMRLQNSPDGVIDSYWLLSGISQEQETNAHQLIYKQYLSTGRSSYSEDGLLDVFTNSWFRFRDLSDGKAERERASKERRAAHISSKLSNPDYSILNDIATDITLKARKGELMEVVGRDDEIRKVEIALTRRDKNNVVLLGDGGVGKSAIVDGIAMRIARDEVLSLKGKKILQFSLNDLSATFGVFSSECIKRFIEEMKREKDVILFIDEVHMLGRAKHLTDLLKPLMARGDFRIIGATTPMEWSAYVSGDTAFVRRFEKVMVEEPSIEDTIKIVETIAPAYENFHHVNFEEDTIELAVRLAKKYLKGEKLPLDTPKTPMNSFKEWWKSINNGNTITILGQEKKLTCEWYGGTYDCLLDINGRIFLVDFKTSNHVTYKYYLQLAAYSKVLREEKNMNIDGVIILQIDKYKLKYREYVLDFNIPEHKSYFDLCERTSLSLLYSYYHISYLEENFGVLDEKIKSNK